MKRGPKNSHHDLTQEYLKSILHYAPGTGVFTWKIALSKRNLAGRQAGFINDKKRIKIGINGKEYMAHRLAWLYIKGVWPKYEIDHIDENQLNNAWKNLRHATPSQNHRNRGAQKNNTTGYKGVCLPKGRNFFIASIKIMGKRKHLGCFKTAEEAFAAYCDAAKKYHGKWAKVS